MLKNNETGAVKMVTDNEMTTFPFNMEANASFENSYVDQWLQQKFLPTLHDYENYLILDSTRDITPNANNKPTNSPRTTLINRPVGILSTYEYFITQSGTSQSEANQESYLNHSNYSWLITPYDKTRVWTVNDKNSMEYIDPANARSVRPVINLKSDIQISSGNGTISNPYRLAIGEQETINGKTLLSTRYSGEYINFNNELYRIIGIENNLIKITSVNESTQLANLIFDNSTVNFSNSLIKQSLENYYQGLDITTKNMIEPNTTWYLGTVGYGDNYKKSICKEVSNNIAIANCEKSSQYTHSNIGLLRIGEVFVSQITRNTQQAFWTLTPYTSSTVRFVNKGYLQNGSPAGEHVVRLAMYLKQNVVISKDNIGDGTYEHPYDIELSP